MEAVLGQFERRAVRYLRESIPVLDKVPADKIIVGVGTAFAAAWAMLANVDIAAWATGIGIISVAIGAGMSSLMTKWATTRIEIQKQEQAAKLEMAQKQAEFDKTNSGTVLAQLQTLAANLEQASASLKAQEARNEILEDSIAILNGSLDVMRERIEDANTKLHDMKGQAQQDKLQHAEEMANLTQRHGMEIGRLTKQLETVNTQLADANRKLASLQVDSKQGRELASEAAQTAVKNSQAIEAVSAKVEQLTGTSGATPTVSP